MPGKSSSIRLPRGLIDLDYIVRTTSKSFRLKALTNRLKDTPGFSVSEDGRIVSGIVYSDSTGRSVHAHLRAEAQARGEVRFTLTVAPGKATPRKPGGLTLSELAPTIRECLANPDEALEGFLQVKSLFKSSEWTSLIPLPFSPPGLLDQIPGAPLIAGIDFAFPAPSDELPLVRGFISSAPGNDELFVSFLLRQSLKLDAALWNSLLANVDKALQVFIRRAKGGANVQS